MKFKRNNYIVTGCFVITFLSLINCSQKIYTKKDVVFSTKRYELKLEYKNIKHRSSLIYMKQKIVKQVSEGDTICSIYDILIMRSLSYRLQNKVFLIVDNEAYPMKIEQKEYENSKIIKPIEEEVKTSDSTSMSVVTGYSENNRKATRFKYSLSNELIEKIKSTEQVLFRYYAGPDMITVTLKGRKLKKMKQLLSEK
jgi:hypothetical protein